MNPAVTVGLLLFVTALLGTAVAARRRGWRHAATWLQLPAAVLLYLTLFPPSAPVAADALTVITPGADERALRRLPRFAAVVALPEAQAPETVERVPDLATALRRRPGVGRLRIVGNGLSPRDLPAALGLAIEPGEAPLRGIVELHAAARAPVGSRWQVAGRSAGTAVARLALHDPAGALVDSIAPGLGGDFRLAAILRGSGPLRFELRALDSAGAVIDHVSVPVEAQPGDRLRLLLRAATPDPETKYLRRWAADAQLPLASLIGLSEGMQLREGDAALTPERLARVDLAIIDERAWLSLQATERDALIGAVDQGMGLLLRVTGPMPGTVASDWAALGFATRDLPQAPNVTLDTIAGTRERDPFTLAPVAIEADDAPHLGDADGGAVLGLWREHGAGRIGIWRLLDGYRMSLRGDPARFGTLWSGVVGRLGRARAQPPEPPIPRDAWLGERSVLCELPSIARVRPTEAQPVPLLVGSDGCAAYWPTIAGWQLVDSRSGPARFYVRASDDGAALRGSRDREATRAAAAATPAGTPVAGAVTNAVPRPRSLFLLGFLLVAGLLWWQERRPHA